jgi:hypothetical protein
MLRICRMDSPPIYEEYRDLDDDTFRRVWYTRRMVLNTCAEVS